ncbi:MAG: peptide deformylase [Spirochaetes bacterium]|nr:peptide deformylase [Spirochaetota bacterium]
MEQKGRNTIQEETGNIRLVYYGNETLKRVAREITAIDDALVELVDSMYRIMYRSGGIGLAAPQVDISKRVIVIDIQGKKGPSFPLINPVILESSEATEPYEEGCLSVPGIMRDVIRPVEILAKGVDMDGNEVEFEAGGLLARVLQHEIDHLNGVLFIDRLEDHVRKELRPELKKIRKLNREP